MMQTDPGPNKPFFFSLSAFKCFIRTSFCVYFYRPYLSLHCPLVHLAFVFRSLERPQQHGKAARKNFRAFRSPLALSSFPPPETPRRAALRLASGGCPRCFPVLQHSVPQSRRTSQTDAPRCRNRLDESSIVATSDHTSRDGVSRDLATTTLSLFTDPRGDLASVIDHPSPSPRGRMPRSRSAR